VRANPCRPRRAFPSPLTLSPAGEGDVCSLLLTAAFDQVHRRFQIQPARSPIRLRGASRRQKRQPAPRGVIAVLAVAGEIVHRLQRGAAASFKSICLVPLRSVLTVCPRSPKPWPACPRPIIDLLQRADALRPAMVQPSFASQSRTIALISMSQLCPTFTAARGSSSKARKRAALSSDPRRSASIWS